MKERHVQEHKGLMGLCKSPALKNILGNGDNKNSKVGPTFQKSIRDVHCMDSLSFFFFFYKNSWEYDSHRSLLAECISNFIKYQLAPDRMPIM